MATITADVIITIEEADGSVIKVAKRGVVRAGDNPSFYLSESSKAVVGTTAHVLTGIDAAVSGGK